MNSFDAKESFEVRYARLDLARRVAAHLRNGTTDAIQLQLVPEDKHAGLHAWMRDNESRTR